MNRAERLTIAALGVALILAIPLLSLSVWWPPYALAVVWTIVWLRWAGSRER